MLYNQSISSGMPWQNLRVRQDHYIHPQPQVFSIFVTSGSWCCHQLACILYLYPPFLSLLYSVEIRTSYTQIRKCLTHSLTHILFVLAGTYMYATRRTIILFYGKHGLKYILFRTFNVKSSKQQFIKVNSSCLLFKYLSHYSGTPPLIWTSRYHSHFTLAQRKAQTVILLFKETL